jgi:metal-responsive CopG/Arc/MetJ family transcriptional regulator
VRAAIVALSAKISRIVSDENETSRSEVATSASISVLSEKRRECDELAQCVPRAIIAVLSENETSYEDSFGSILDLIKTLQEKNVFVQTRLKDIETSDKRQRESSVKSDYTLKNGFLKFRGRYYVSEKEFLRTELLKRHHDDILAGHFDVKKTVELLSRKYH